MLIIVTVAAFVVMVGGLKDWPAWDRWTAMLFASFAACVAMEVLAEASRAWIVEIRYDDDGTAVNAAAARHNLHLAHMAVAWSLIAAGLFTVTVALYFRKVRRDAGEANA